jgi:S1-C subfamily serine protease
VDRYNYDAAFWRKRTKPPILGLVSVKLAEEDRRRYERNKGVAVHALLTNGPAYNAGILEGDVIIAIGMDEISDVDHFKATLRKYAGQMVELTVLRAGRQKTVPVQLNQSVD